MEDEAQSGVSPEGPPSLDDVPSGRSARRVRRSVVAGGVAVLLVGASAVGLSLATSSPASADAVVSKALVTTLSHSTLAFNLTEGLVVVGQNVTITGSGQCILSSAECDMNVQYGGALSRIGSVQEVLDGGVAYLKFGSAVASRFPTPWVSMPVNTSKLLSTSTLGASGSPLSLLTMLAHQGAVVADGGSVVVNGQALHQYNVTFSSSSAQSLISSKLQDLPSWMTTAIKGASFGAVSMKVDLNAQGELATTSMTTSVTVSGQTVNVNVGETITGYGVPVQVTVPPANEVTPLSTPSLSPLG